MQAQELVYQYIIYHVTFLNAQPESLDQAHSFPQHQISLLCVEPSPPIRQSDHCADLGMIYQIFELVKSSEDEET